MAAFKLDEVAGVIPYGAVDSESYLQCPYYGEHTIIASRMQFHLNKCRQSFPNIPKKQCPFDVTHWVNEPELGSHMENCGSRITFDSFKYKMDVQTPLVISAPPTMPAPESDEIWDGVGGAGYDPNAAMEARNVIRKPHGVQPAVRKQFRMDQRRHFTTNPNIPGNW